MTVKEFINVHPVDANTKRKAKLVQNENVLSGGNDMWLADELNMNRSEIEAIATKTKFS